jgi:chromate transporter
MTLLRLFFEFFKTGLFAVGGGLATIPFLTDLGNRTGWFSPGDLADMIAVSESTPGPIGVNMATYVGFRTAGFPGGVVATLGLIAPSVLIIPIISLFLQKFRQNKVVDAVFKGLRPASMGLIAAAFLQVCSIALLDASPEAAGLIRWPAVALAAVIFLCIKFPPLKNLHPVAFIAVAAAAGVLFQM